MFTWQLVEVLVANIRNDDLAVELVRADPQLLREDRQKALTTVTDYSSFREHEADEAFDAAVAADVARDLKQQLRRQRFSLFQRRRFYWSRYRYDVDSPLSSSSAGDSDS